MKKKERMEVNSNVVEFVKKALKGRDASHDYVHAERVRLLVRQIAKIEVSGYSTLVHSKSFNRISALRSVENMEIAALLHDVEDHKYKSKYSVKVFLESLFKDDRVKTITDIISTISFSKKRQKTTGEMTREQRIVQDADRLDAMGAYGIARCFMYGGHKGDSITEVMKHFDDKLLKLKDLMKTRRGLEMAISRHKYMIGFLKQMKLEAEDTKVG